MNKAINGWHIEYFSVTPTYSGLYEGDPADPFIKNMFLKNADEDLKKRFGIDIVNILNTEGEGRLPRYKVSLFLMRYNMTEDDASLAIICYVEEVNNISGIVQKILDENPELKTETWVF